MLEIRTKCGLPQASFSAFSERWKTKRTIVQARKVMGIAIAFLSWTPCPTACDSV